MAPFKKTCINSTTAFEEPPRTQPIQSNGIFSRGVHTLHRRTAGAGTIGVAAGLAFLAVIIMGGLFYCAWVNIKAEQQRQLEAKTKRKHRHGHRRHGTRIRGGRHRHSRNHHHVHDHDAHVYIQDPYVLEKHHETHHRRHKHSRRRREPGDHHDRRERKIWRRHHRCRHLQCDEAPVIDGWAPRRPEPILQSGIALMPEYSGLPPNEMDAPQIGRDFKRPDCFSRRSKVVDGVFCPRHGVVKDDGD